MKKTLLVIFALCVQLQLHARTVQVVRTANGTERNDYLHKAANVFADKVGKALKKNFPSRVASATVKLTLEKGKIKITYTAVLQKCPKSLAEEYFEHGGALAVKKTKEAAKADATTRCQAQKGSMEHIFAVSYGGVTSLPSHPPGVYFKGNWWDVSENFFMNKL